MKKLLFLLAILLGSVTYAQQTERQHRIIMQLTSGDSLVHKNLMKQFKNMKEAAKVKEFAAQVIVFLACDNTIRERNLDTAKVLPEAGHVKAGIIHIVERQEDGWSYIKAGF